MGWCCFQNSGLEEIALPMALKKIDDRVFESCDNLRSIYLDEGCEASIYKAKILNSVAINLSRETIVGNIKLLDLRGCK